MSSGLAWFKAVSVTFDNVPYGLDPRLLRRRGRKPLPPGPADVMPPGLIGPDGSVVTWEEVEKVCREEVDAPE